MKRNEIQRAALDHDIASFLAAGGSITVVPFGESGEEVTGRKRSGKKAITIKERAVNIDKGSDLV